MDNQRRIEHRHLVVFGHAASSGVRRYPILNLHDVPSSTEQHDTHYKYHPGMPTSCFFQTFNAHYDNKLNRSVL